MKPIFIDLPTLADVLALSESTIQKLTREDTSFPRPRQLSVRRVGWLTSEIEQWALARPISDLLPPENTGAKKGRLSTRYALEMIS